MTAADLAWRGFVLLTGPFAGTYVATLASAWPRAPRPVLGRSRCAACGAPVPAWRQIPLVSWLAQRGARACCGGRIPLTYPLGEAWGLAAGALALIQADAAHGALMFVVGLTLAYIGLVDLRRYSIPIAGLAVLAAAALGSLAIAWDLPAAAARLATGAALALLFLLLRRLIRRDGRAGLGGGDIMLAALLGVLAGWRWAPVLVAAAALAPLALQLATKRRGPVAFGFWLALTAMPVIAWAR